MPNRRNIYFYYKKVENSDNNLQPLFNLAKRNNYSIVDRAEDANIIISVGGDGTFLQAVRKTGFRQDCLYMGITQFDDLALYCDFKMDSFGNILQTMENEEMKVRR